MEQTIQIAPSYTEPRAHVDTVLSQLESSLRTREAERGDGGRENERTREGEKERTREREKERKRERERAMQHVAISLGNNINK